MYEYSINNAMFFTIVVIAFILTLIINGIIVYRCAEKAGIEDNKWFAFIPILNNLLLLRIVKMSGWCLLLLFIPIVNVILTALIMVKFLQAFGQNPLLLLIALIPGIGGLIVLGIYFYIAFSNNVEYVYE